MTNSRYFIGTLLVDSHHVPQTIPLSNVSFDDLPENTILEQGGFHTSGPFTDFTAAFSKYIIQARQKLRQKKTWTTPYFTAETSCPRANDVATLRY